MSVAPSPKQNVVSLRDGRAVVGVAFDGASPCLTSYSFTRGLSDAERERFSVVQNPEAYEKHLRQARNDGHIMPVRFCDRPAGMTALVLVGDLAPEYESEWIGCATWRLNVPCGYLGISAGWHLLKKPDGHLEWSGDPYFKYVRVPPGDYLVRFLAYFPADEAIFDAKGRAARFVAPGSRRGVPIGKYFRKTRPNEPLPDWLTAHLMAYPEHDPGHEEEWEEMEEDEIEVEDYLYHVIWLTPITNDESPLGNPRNLWLPFEMRTLPKCPLGLPLSEDAE